MAMLPGSRARAPDESREVDGFVVTHPQPKIELTVEEQLEYTFSSLVSQQMTPQAASERMMTIPMTGKDRITLFRFLASKLAPK